MKTTFAYISMLLGVAFYGLLLFWLVALARQGGVLQVPQMLSSLGRDAAIYGFGLILLGTGFLFAARFLFGSRVRQEK